MPGCGRRRLVDDVIQAGHRPIRAVSCTNHALRGIGSSDHVRLASLRRSICSALGSLPSFGCRLGSICDVIRSLHSRVDRGCADRRSIREVLETPAACQRPLRDRQQSFLDR